MKTDKRIKFLSNIINSRDIVPQFEPSFENVILSNFCTKQLLFLINEENLERYFAREELRFSSFVTSINRLLIKKWNIHIVLKKDFVILLSFELAILSREALICHCSKSRLREHDDLWIRMDVSSIIIVRYAYVMGSNVVIKRVYMK